MELGPRAVVAKQGEYGAALFSATASSRCPPIRSRPCIDPTGAGDSFAGGFLGYLASPAPTAADEEPRCAAR